MTSDIEKRGATSHGDDVALDICESHLLIVSHGRRFIQKVALDFN